MLSKKLMSAKRAERWKSATLHNSSTTASIWREILHIIGRDRMMNDVCHDMSDLNSRLISATSSAEPPSEL